MICITFIFLLVCLLPKLSDGVQVNMQGSLTLGKEVMDKLLQLIQMNTLVARRSAGTGGSNAGDSSEEDIISLIVNSAFLCRDISFCQKDETATLLNDYIITLTKVIEGIFVGLVNNMNARRKDNTKNIIFEEELRHLLQDVKKMIKSTDEKINDHNAVYTWINLIKKINAMFQDRAEMFAGQRVEGNAREVIEFKNKFTLKLLISTSLVELTFEAKLCYEHDICPESYECTNALYDLLERIQNIPNEKTKQFIRYFAEALPSTKFYYIVTDITGHEFKSILHDMAYAENILTKNVLAIVQKSVEGRLNATKTKFATMDIENGGRDVMLVHTILSDMDHFYSNLKDPFRIFLRDFNEWADDGEIFITPFRRVMKDIQNTLNTKSDELVFKLINEVRVFMEITVDPVP